MALANQHTPLDIGVDATFSETSLHYPPIVFPTFDHHVGDHVITFASVLVIRASRVLVERKHCRHPLPKVCVQHFLCKNGAQLYSYLVCRFLLGQG